MTAPEAVSAPAGVKWWQHFGGPKALVFPTIVVLVLLVLGFKAVTAKPDPAEQTAAQQQAAYDGASKAIDRTLGATASPTTIAPAPIPLYDYLSCSHVVPGDGAPCVPLAPWPITQGAKELIGYQQGGIQGELSTVKTRIVADQIRNNMAGVDPCQLWLGLARDENMNPILTVYPNQGKAEQGATKLYNCTPSGSTKGTVPTEGAS